MNDTGQTHSIYDGLNLRQVIALHQQALGELATLQSGIDNELCDIRLDTEALKAELSLKDQAAAIVQIQLAGWVGRAEAAEKELAAWRAAGNARNPHAQLAVLVDEIRGIAEESILPDGDGVTVPVALWAESVLERFAALAAEHDLAIRAESYEAGRPAEKAAQQATYWADGKMPKEPTFSKEYILANYQVLPAKAGSLQIATKD